MGLATRDARSSYVRTFNRYEFKYLLSIEQAHEFERALGSYVKADPHDPDGEGPLDLLVRFQVEDDVVVPAVRVGTVHRRPP